MSGETAAAHAGLRQFLAELPGYLPEPPRAVLVVTAHWEASEFTLNAAARPTMVYDYGGFPPETYQVRYGAPGAPELAEAVAAKARAAGIPITLETHRGWDHGVFVPMAVSWPAADVPVLAMSLRRGLDPAEHLAVGALLRDLRDQGVLVLGSGFSTHDLSFRVTQQQAAAFDTWLTETALAEPELRDQRLLNWESAPSARAAHPREEHLLPLMVVAGAAPDERGHIPFRDSIFGLIATAVAFGDFAVRS
jgi:aromatic ring-opening dioxygenase catalytic subunit (LigB family)